jgi:hypothetical protein
MRPLIIGPEEKEKIEQLKNFAELNRISVDDLLDIYNRREPPVGDRVGFSCMIPMGYRIVFCIEHQVQGWARHLSVSVNPRKKGRMASPAAVEEFMKLLGFQSTGVKDPHVHCLMEDDNSIINVVEYIK